MLDMERSMLKGIEQIIMFVNEAGKTAIQEIKTTNHDTSFEKIYDLLNEEDESEQDRMEIGN